ncbi:MAG: dehydrogenase (quinone) [Firmicutes bacterium]|nr:dehydrogenase (quinone) [Bacillota bacterium]
MNPAVICGAVFIILVLAAGISLVVQKWRPASILSMLAVLAAGAGMLVLAFEVFLSGPVDFSYGWQVASFPARLAFHVDYLSAFFLFLIALLSICSAVYALGFMPVFRAMNPGRYYVPFILFVTGMYGVVVSADLFYFLLFWETMTLFSYLLVVFEDSPSNLKAGFTYFLVTQIASVGLIVVSVFLYSRTGSLLFTDLPGLFKDLAIANPGVLHLMLALFFIAFGAKAGVFPLGFWMPGAYAAAPASATAVFSGVMSKMGVYGILRVFVWLLPVSGVASTWGLIIASFGVLSMLIGNLRALVEVDGKRLLAQSSIGQMGYILLGIGAGLYFQTTVPVISALAYIGAVYHVLNHAFFKSLLFFNMGSIFYRTGTNDLNQVGGMIKLMPAACAAGLVGSLAISGMPPFNGFMSKWLLYQASIFGGSTAPIFALFGVIAIFISTVSLAAYLKYIGTAYLGILPKKFSNEPVGQPFSMEVIQVLLALGCILLGLLPGLPVRIFYDLVSSSAAGVLPQAGQVMSKLAWGGNSMVQLNSNLVYSGYTPLVVLVALLVGILLSWALSRVYRVPVQPVEIWSCGERVESDLIRYRASSFYRSFTDNLAFLYRNRSWPQLKLPVALPAILDLDRWLFFPIAQGFLKCSRIISLTHRGRPQLYLLWQVIGIVLVFLGIFWLKGV